MSISSITGKALLPYQVPRTIHIQCQKKNKCDKCTIPDDKILQIEPEDSNIAKFLSTPEIYFKNIVRDILKLSNRCPIMIEVKSIYTVEEVYLTESQISNKASVSTTRVGYTINKHLEYNVPYVLKCYSVPEPKSQKIIHVILDAERMKTNLEFFELSSENILEMKKLFSPSSEDAEFVFKHLQFLYEIYAHNVTKIFNRFDIHMAIDLVFHSPLQFKFGNEFVHKGWLDIMVLGDTRCGKGFVSENLVKYYGLGEVISGENASFAGLVGGLQQIGSRWVVSWGKIPVNNKRLVIIDESGELEAKDFSRLSRIRSEGIAEISKIQAEKAVAMTRLIFLSSPKQRMISSYSFGIEAIRDIVESAEDIARFDYVLILAQTEVNVEEINKNRKTIENPYEKYDPMLVNWIWSRNKNQVIFEKETIDLILQYSIKLGQIYSPSLPLIQGENIRFKLARIAASIAGRLFSSDDNGINLIVKPIHVKIALIFINLIYKKHSSGYYHFSQIQKQSDAIHAQPELEKYMYSFENKEDLVGYFLENNYITVIDLSEWLNQPKEVAREIISKLLHHKCIQKKYTFYVKNQCFTRWLQQHR